MKTTIAFFVVLLILPAVCVGQSPAAEAPQWQLILNELRNLRIELLQDRIERAGARLAQLQFELQKTETERATISQMELSQAEELALLRDRLTDPALSAASRGEIEKQHSLLMSSESARLAEQKAAAVRRETEVRGQLAAQQQLGLQLVEKLRALMNSASAKP
jgi:hypothetical protein